MRGSGGSPPGPAGSPDAPDGATRAAVMETVCDRAYAASGAADRDHPGERADVGARPGQARRGEVGRGADVRTRPDAAVSRIERAEHTAAVVDHPHRPAPRNRGHVTLRRL